MSQKPSFDVFARLGTDLNHEKLDLSVRAGQDTLHDIVRAARSRIRMPTSFDDEPQGSIWDFEDAARFLRHRG